MEPVEINAGDHYLRQLRADDRIDDRPTLLAAFADPELRRWAAGVRVDDLAQADRYVRRRAQEWIEDRRCSWAVANPQTGALVGEVGLKDLDLAQGVAEVSCWTHPDHRGRGIAVAAVQAVLRFGFGGLDLHHVSYRHAAGNTASRLVAERCGFALCGRLPQAALVDGARDDVLVWSRLARD